MPNFKNAAFVLLAAMAFPGVQALAAPRTVAFKTIYAFVGNATGFSKDGAYPESEPILLDNTLYGATIRGGKYDNGTLFAYDIATGSEKTVYNFNVENGMTAMLGKVAAPINHLSVGQEAIWVGTGKNKYIYADYIQQYLRYNATKGDKFLCSFGPSESELVNVALAIKVGGQFITSESNDPSNVHGAIVSVDHSACTLATLYAFTGGTDGSTPNGPLVYRNGLIYGSTENGGASSKGVVFAYNPTTQKESVIYTFTGGKDGTNPTGLVFADGHLYGTTSAGGANGLGTVFRIDPATGKENTLHAFQGAADGANPAAPLIRVGTSLYGTAPAGGENNEGTVFQIDMKTGAETTLHSFSVTDGSIPIAPLTYYNGVFYGTTVEGGVINEGSPDGAGTIFQFTN